MTRVDFYQLADSSNKAPLLTSCKLIKKALAQHGSVYVQVPDLRTGEQLDELLWQFEPDAFIPHALLPRDEKLSARVAIGVGVAPDVFADVLINLSDALPHQFQRFERLLELVPASEEQRLKARERYSFYKQRGYPLHYHDLEKSHNLDKKT